MSDGQPKRVEVLLVESVGAFYFGAGTPQVVCRFEAVPPFRAVREQDRRISCLVWKGTGPKEKPETRGTWHEFSPTIRVGESDAFVDYVAALSLPDRSTFAGELDTGAVLKHVLLRVSRDSDVRSYDIHLYQSGFVGDGADTLKALCRRLFELAGYSDYDEVMYGHRP